MNTQIHNMTRQTNSKRIIISFVVAIHAFFFFTSNAAFANEASPVITVYKSPTCGCCGKWVDHLKSQGFTVDAKNRNDLDSIKRELGIHPSVQSCHTAKIGKYIVEGHVPAEDIKRMIKEKPKIDGLAVPEMPMGSPGMEGNTKDDYNVLAIKQGENPTIYNSH